MANIIVRFEDVPTFGYNQMYKLSTKNFMLQGVMYSMLIGQYLWCTMKLELKKGEMVDSIRTPLLGVPLSTSCWWFEIHQLTFNENEFMDMLRNDPSPWHVIWWHHKKCCFVFNDMVDKSNYNDFQIRKNEQFCIGVIIEH
jgi:hypothetical protein